MKKYNQQIDAHGNPVVAGETPEYDTATAAAAAADTHGNPIVAGETLEYDTAAAATAGEEEMRTSVVDTSGFGMYCSGTGTGAITGGGILHDQYVTTPTAIQSQLPCSLAGYSSSEDDGMGGRRKKKGTKEKIQEKVVPASPAAGMTISADGNGQQGDTHHEKKGLMERIKEKLPCHHHHHHHH